MNDTHEIPGFTIEFLFGREVAVASIVGSIPRELVSQAEEALRRVILGGCRRIVVDCSRADRISSTGIGAVVYYGHRLAAEGGALAVVSPPEPMRSRFAELRLDTMLPICETRAEALELVRRKAR